jgi:hypothetical protein
MDGKFRATRVPLGSYSVVIEAPPSSGDAALGRSRRTIGGVQALTDGQTVDLGDIELRGTGDLAGTVTLSDQPAVGAAAGALVTIADSAGFRGVVGRDGAFSLAHLPEGSFDVVVFFDGYAPGHLGGVQVSANETATLRNIALSPRTGSLTTAVSGQVSLTGSTDASGVRVDFLDEIHTSSTVPAATSDAMGRYTLPAVPIGSYRVRFQKDSYQKVEIPGVAVLPDGVVGLLLVALAKAIPGDENGNGIPDAMDPDRDGDGCPNVTDAFPDDPFACLDQNHDGIPDELEPDLDFDGLSNAEETSPGRDGWITDPLNKDTDGDGIDDFHDDCPTIPDPRQERGPDGVGLACANGPSIADFSPKVGGVGTRVTITGFRFNAAHPEFNVIRFGRGFALPSTPPAVTDGSLDVLVPADADSGPIQLSNGTGATTSSAAFSFVDPPVIYDFAPKRVVSGGIVAVTGSRFDAPGFKVSVNGVEAAASPITIADPTATPPRQLFTLTVPSTGGGPIRVQTIGGAADTAQTIQIIGPPEIDSLNPNPAVIGQPLLILGRGLSPPPAAGPVQVDFAGAPGQVPSSVSDTAITVTVPVGTITGTIAVRHAAGTTHSAMPLVIDAAAPVIASIDHTLLEPGDALVLQGANLGGAIDVAIGGVRTSSIIMSTPFELQVRVPDGAQPGPVVVHLAQGMSVRTATALAAVSILEERSAPVSNLYWADLGIAFLASGTELAVVGVFASGPLVAETGQRTLDAASLTVLSTVSFGALGQQAYPSVFLTSTDERWAVLGVRNNLLSLISYPATTLASCPLPAGANFRALGWVTDPNSTFAYGLGQQAMSGIVRVDVSAGTCGTFAATPGLTYGALLPTGNAGELLVSTTGGGYARLLSVPGSPLDGTFSVPVRMNSVGMNSPYLLPAPDDPAFVWASGVNASLVRFDPFSDEAPFTLFPRDQAGISTYNTAWAQSTDRRWLLAVVSIPGGQGLAFYDLLARRLARVHSMAGFEVDQIAAHPRDASFVLLSSSEDRIHNQLGAFRILAAPN